MYHCVTAVYNKKITSVIFLGHPFDARHFGRKQFAHFLAPEPKHLRQSATQHVESVCVDVSFNCLSAVAISDTEWLQHCRCRNISDIAGRHRSLCQLFWHTLTQLSFLSCFYSNATVRFFRLRSSVWSRLISAFLLAFSASQWLFL